MNLPSKEARLALYSNVTNELRHLKDQQWRFAVLILALIVGIGSFASSNAELLKELTIKIFLVILTLISAIFGFIHLSRIQAHLTTNKNVRHLLEKSLKLDTWEDLSAQYRLLGSNRIHFFGNWFEFVMWSFGITVFSIGVIYIILK